MDLTPNSVFLITGAARGIGAATARLVHARGHPVVIADIDMAEAEALAAELGDQAIAVALDVTQPEQWGHALDRAMERFGRIDVLVNNAGLLTAGFLDRQPEVEIRGMLDVNVWGLICGFRAGARVFETQGFGHFVTVGSITAFVPTRGQSVYAATKHAVRALHHAFEMECKGRPFRFSMVHPSTADTRLRDAQRTQEAAALSFANPPLAPARIAKVIYTAVAKRRREVVIPALHGFFSRLIGVYPGLLSLVLASAWKRGARNRLRKG